MESALPLIAERGAGRVTMRDIAAVSGVSLGTVSYHFTGVRELVSEAIALDIARYYDPVLAAVREAPTAAAGLRILVDAIFTDDTDRHWRLWFDWWGAGDRGAVSDAVTDGQAAERYDRWQRDIRSLIARGAAGGEFDCADPDAAAALFVAVVDGLALQRLRGVPPLGSDEARRHLDGFVAVHLRPREGDRVSGSSACCRASTDLRRP